MWKDIDINLSKQHDGDVKADLEIDAIKNSITSIFKTFQGSRRMVPSFAMPVFNLLFEPIDKISLSKIKSMLLNAISLWENRIIIENLEAVPYYDNNQIDIKLQFRIKSDTDDKVYNINNTMIMRG